MSRHNLTIEELKFLERSLNSEIKVVNIRLRQGEYQYDLAKEIASFELELVFPNVKELISKLYGKERTQDIKFIRKVQTILKKMEKSNIVRILTKQKPWDLQRYALTSFKFQDVDRDHIILVEETAIKRTLDLVHSQLNSNRIFSTRPNYTMTKITILVFTIVVSYIAIFWTLVQPAVDLFIFVPVFCIATICSILLGRVISRRK